MKSDQLEELSKAGKAYLKLLRKSSYEIEKSGLMIETFQYRKTKEQVDQIDTILAEHYGFTEEELDFIINYDIKYRMGLSSGSGQEEGDE